MLKASLVSVVEDDQFFRQSMRRLLRSLGYTVEGFPSAPDFLASPCLVATAFEVEQCRLEIAELSEKLEWATGRPNPTPDKINEAFKRATDC